MLENEVIINNSKVRYIEKQGGDDTVFVFLHGWGSAYTIFSPLYPAVNTLLAFDFPGCGGSPEPEKAWDLAEYAKLTEAFLEKKAGIRKITFVAHSFGGKVLMKMLNQHTIDAVRQIVCIGVPFVHTHSTRNAILRRWSGIAGRALSYLPESMTQKTKKIWHGMIGAEDYSALKNEVMKKTFQNILNEEVMDYCTALKEYKTDFIWGENDTAAPLSDAVPIAGKTGARLHVIKDGDHFPFRGKTESAFLKTFQHIIRL